MKIVGKVAFQADRQDQAESHTLISMVSSAVQTPAQQERASGQMAKLKTLPSGPTDIITEEFIKNAEDESRRR